jgi:hypothetical protein
MERLAIKLKKSRNKMNFSLPIIGTQHTAHRHLRLTVIKRKSNNKRKFNLKIIIYNKKEYMNYKKESSTELLQIKTSQTKQNNH